MSRSLPPSRPAARHIGPALIAALTISPSAHASTASWLTATSGTWSDPTNWSTNPALPAPSDDVRIAAPGDYAVLLDASSPATTVKSITLSAGTLSLSGGSLSVTSLDTSGNPARFNWTGGTFATSNLTIAPDRQLGPSVDITPGKTLVHNGAIAMGVGSSITGFGTLTQTGGTILLPTSSLVLTNGHYSISSGTLQTGGGVGVGLGSSGSSATMTQTGGAISAVNLQIAVTLNTAGTFTLAGGTFNTDFARLSNLSSSTATLIHTGGTLSISPTGYSTFLGLYTAYAGTASYSLSGSAVLSTPSLHAGFGGTGTFTQTGGAATVTGDLNVASYPGSRGSYLISAGTLAAASAYVGGTASSLGGTGSFTISDSATVSIAGPLKIWNTPNSSLRLTGGSLTVASLDLSSPAALDLSGGCLHIPYATTSPAPDIRTHLLAGRITSSAAANDPSASLSIGYTDDGSTLLLQLTPTGDANLDGQLDADDYALLDHGFLTDGQFWQQGDFNYDGIINNQDYSLLDRTYGLTHALTPSLLATRESQFGSAYVHNLLTTIPEPTPSSILYSLSSLLLLPRLRPRHPRNYRP